MGSPLRGKNIKRTIVNDVASSITYITNSSGTESIAMSPLAAWVALGGQTSSLRVSRGGELAVGADVERTVLTIVTCARAPKALSKGGSGATRDGDIKEVHWGRDNRMIVSQLYDNRAVGVHSILV